MRATAACVFVLALGCTQAPADGGDESGSESTTETAGETGEPELWQPSLQAGEDIGALMSVWGPSPDEVFAVGGQPELGVALRFDGAEWTNEALPADVAMLNWVYGVGGSVWAVGVGGAIVRREVDAWVAEISPTASVLWGVWGASADELWAVGGESVGQTPVLLRRDGASEVWELVELPPLETAANALFKVWGFAADDVWVVGDLGVTLHYDGVEWTAHPDPDAIDLISVWGSESEGLVAVGGRANGRVDRFVGDAWSGQTLAIPGLNGVWIDPGGTATAVGVQGTIIRISPGGYEVEASEDAGTTMVLHSVFGFPGGPRWAVGGSLLMPAPFVGVILRSDS